MPEMDRLLDKDTVEALTSLHRKTIYRMEKVGQFPRRRQVSPVRVGWLASEVMAWLKSRPAVGLDVTALPSPNKNGAAK